MKAGVLSGGIRFFTEHLGMTVEERRDHEARLAQKRRPHLMAAAP
jgi:hypothetical protein